MQLLLQREGYETRWCQDESLYSLLEEWKPDLILMDLRMPRLDGETATQAIKSNPATSSIPIILVTAEQVSKERLKVISANEMLPKPFRVPLLLERVRYWISRYRRGEDQGSSLDRGLSPAI
jgi:chemosensory pili system protein ChpA (sensor histidine kinase/response regulator)